MMIDLKAMRESLGLTPIKQNEDAEIEIDEKSESDCILQMQSPLEKVSKKRGMQLFSQQVDINRRECTIATGLTQSCITYTRVDANLNALKPKPGSLKKNDLQQQNVLEIKKKL